MDKKRSVKVLYDKSAKFYDERYQDIQRNKFNVFFDNLELSDLLVDLGCGTSLILNHPQIYNIRYVGLDNSIEMIREAILRKHYFREYIIADVENIPFRNNWVNLISIFTVLQNLEIYEKLAKELKRISTKKSLIYISILKKKFNKNKFQESLTKNHLKINKRITIKNSEDFGLIIINT
jgi:ubiquinone/menaquinone biosynthesis C-methylase UbiE